MNALQNLKVRLTNDRDAKRQKLLELQADVNTLTRVIDEVGSAIATEQQREEHAREEAEKRQ